MSEAPASREPDDRGGAPGSAPTGMPRWVKLLGVAALAVLAVIVVVLLVAGGDHGPARHMGAAGQLALAGGADAGRAAL